MRRSEILLCVALLTSVAASAWMWDALRTERARNAELSGQLQRQGVELQRLTDVAAFATSEAEAAPAPAAPSAAAGAAAATPTKVVADTEHQQNWLMQQRQLMRDPKYREARRAQDRLKYAQRRANLIRLLNFTPEEADATIELDIDQDFRWEEENAIYGDSEEARKDAKARAEAIQREHQDKLRALLGEEKRLRLQGYMESRESRMQVEDLRSSLTEANALRDDQVEPLIAALHVERAQMKAELAEFRDTLSWEGDTTESARRWFERQTELMKAMNTRMLSSASSLLDQSQLKALDAQLQKTQAEREARDRLGRIQMKIDAASRAGTTSN